MNFNNLRTPGVYIDEVDNLPLSVVPVETAIPAFIGYTLKHQSLSGKELLNVPTKIFSLNEYKENFGDRNGIIQTETAKNINVTLIADPDDDTKLKFGANGFSFGAPSKYNLYYALQLYFLNGGGPCYIVSVGTIGADISDANLQAGLDALETEEEPTLIVVPEATQLIVPAVAADPTAVPPVVATPANPAKYNTLIKNALMQCEATKNRFVIMDVPTKYPSTTPFADLQELTDFRVLDATDVQRSYGAAYYPFLETIIKHQYEEKAVNIAAPGGATSTLDKFVSDAALVTFQNRGEIYTDIKNQISNYTNVLPPSAAIAGVYAQVDRNVGVWKAPANIILNGVSKPVVKIRDNVQDGMNLNNNGKSINAIREKYGKVNIVWGARTYDSLSNSWKYINVRRFFIMAETSIKNSLVGVVFEPNDANTWVRVRATIENFLTLQWRAGALQGAKPEHAFYVRVGLNQTMTSTDILEGRLIVEIGMAVVRPAEFIVLTFMQKLAES